MVVRGVRAGILRPETSLGIGEVKGSGLKVRRPDNAGATHDQRGVRVADAVHVTRLQRRAVKDDPAGIAGHPHRAPVAADVADFSIYPNPASEQVSFVLDNDAQVCIFDMTGRMVNEVNVAAGNAQLNVSELESGVYFVNIRYTNGGTAVSKFVKY